MKEHPTSGPPFGSLLRAAALAAGLLVVAGSAPGQWVTTATSETSTVLVNVAEVSSATLDNPDRDNNSATVETTVLPRESILEIPTLSTVAGVLLGGLLAALGLLTLRRHFA